ncbi:MFS transporter [Kiloniella sp. b19]|uniref:MFS transporter n=1 Tax=Kiloniella sp. GXU_MW_B19 TaxID=3141326 RepID=UPI0031DC2410
MQPYLFVLLILTTALGPLAMQMYIALASVVEFGHALSGLERMTTVSVSLIALGIANITFGPVSDRIGKPESLLLGLVVFIFGSVLASWSESFHALVLARVIQAYGGGCGLVVSRALIRDLSPTSYKADQAYTILVVTMVAAPMVGPWLSGVLLHVLDIRGLFELQAALGCLMLVLLGLWALPVMMKEKQGRTKGVVRENGLQSSMVLELLKNRFFVRKAVAASVLSSVFFVFVAVAPAYFRKTYGLTVEGYGVVFLLTTLCFVAGALVALGRRRLLNTIPLGMAGNGAGWERFLLQGFELQNLSLLSLLAALSFFVFLVSGYSSLHVAVGMMLFIGFIQGVAVPNMQNEAMKFCGRLSGSASGIIGFLQMGLAGVVVQILGFVGASMEVAAGIILFQALLVVYFVCFKDAGSELLPGQV